MKFEFLPNELILNLFEYLEILPLFQIFSYLNSRFHTLVLHHCRKCSLDFQSIAKTDFDIICQTYLPSFADRIQSLRLSDDDQTPQQIALFCSFGFRLHQFIHLQIITLSNLHFPSLFDQLLTDCTHLPSLLHLTFINCHLSIDRSHADRLYNQIWSLSTLTSCYIDINFANRNYFPHPTVLSTSLRYLSIPNISCYLDELVRVFQTTPNLRHLSIEFIDYVKDLPLVFPIVSIRRLELTFDCSLNVLQNLLQNLPDLNYLTLETSDMYMDGYQWEELIGKYLVNLKILQFKMRFPSFNDECKESQINQILDSFRTKFWIVEHQWFVRCHWYTSNKQYNSDFMDLFTLPYAFKDFLSYTDCILVKSTCPHEDEYWSYEHVNHLSYGSSHFTSSIMSHIRFSNIKNLSLSLPFNEQFLSIVSKLDRLISLCISINNQKKTENIHSQLQILLDRASRLYSLSFGSCYSTCLPELLMENTSKSIRRLNFQDYAWETNWGYFDDEQCVRLSRSTLGIQCETLLIRVKQRRNVLGLVNNMPNLRALNVRCEDDDWANENNTVISTPDELLEWLRQQLPSSCLIIRDILHMHEIRLWIR